MKILKIIYWSKNKIVNKSLKMKILCKTCTYFRIFIGLNKYKNKEVNCLIKKNT